MKAIRFIARDDLRRIHTNVMASIFVAVLVALPLLFTWFNVLASWDPFANSDRLKIAVANTDEGYKTDVLNVKVNVGDQVLSQLRANKSLDWVITDETTAVDGTRSGEYYAAIVLPENFSTKMFTFYAGGAAPSDIMLYINEKKNALSENISNQGAQGVTAEINSSFTEVLSEVTLGLARDLSTSLNDSETAAVLDRMQTRLGSLSDQLKSGAGTVRSFQSLVGASIPLVDGSQKLTAALNESLASSGGASALGNESDLGLGGAADSLANSLQATQDAINQIQKRLNDILDTVSNATEGQASALLEAADGVDVQVEAFVKARAEFVASVPLGLRGDEAVIRFLGDFDAAIDAQRSLSLGLRGAAEDLKANPDTTLRARSEAREAIKAAADAIATARDNYRAHLEPELEQLRSSLTDAKDSLSVVGSHLQRVTADLASDHGLKRTLRDTQKSLAASADSMTDSAKRLDGALKQLNDARTTNDLQRVAEIIGSDPAAFAKLLSAPVTLERHALFPVATFGVGMTPLYGTIALWIGALLAGAFIRTDVPRSVYRRYKDSRGEDVQSDDDEDGSGESASRDDAEGSRDEAEEDEGGFSGAQEYFGRFFLFWLVGMAQSTLLMLGLIVFVDIQPAHPWLLMVCGWAASTVFVMMIYTLVLSLSNAGKAVAVVFLVLQISAAGGAYPLELLPSWFQNISPWLPATYVINMMRAAIAGIYQGDFLINLGMLALFLIPTLLIGLVLRHPIASWIQGTTAALETTKVM